MASYDCPHCASPAVQAYSQLGYGFARPERKGIGCAGWLCVLMAIAALNAFVMLASSHGIAVKTYSILPAAMAILFAYLAFRQSRVAAHYNKELYPIAVSQWAHSFHCHRCGHNFIR